VLDCSSTRQTIPGATVSSQEEMQSVVHARCTPIDIAMITILLLENANEAGRDGHQLTPDPDYNILTASSSESAIEFANRHAALIDVAVVDVELDDTITGIDIANDILADTGIPVIFQLNTSNDAIIEQISGTHALGCIDKNSSDYVKKATIFSTLRFHHIKPKSGKWAHLFSQPEWELSLGSSNDSEQHSIDEIKKINSILYATLDSIDEGILVVDRIGIISDLNKQFIRMWDIPEELTADRDDKDLLNSILCQLSYPDAFLKKVEYYYAHPEKSGTDIIELKSGKKYERYSQPQQLDGEIVGRVWSFRDVTERMLSDAALIKLQKAVDTSSDAIFLTDKEGSFTYINPGFTMMYGYTPQDVVGRATPKIIRSGNVDEDAYAKFWDTIAQNSEVRGEFITKRKNGACVHVDATASPILDEHGALMGYLGIQRDITERKKAEAALTRSELLLRTSQEVAKIGYFVTDIATGEWESSPVLNKIFGLDGAIVHDGENWNELIAPQFRQSTLEHYHETIRDKGHYNIDYQIVRPTDGEIRWVSAIGELEYDGSGSPIRMIGTVQDITDRKLLEQQLLQSQKLEGIGTLAGGIAHDFNNLLALILGSAELLQQQTAGQPAMKKYVDRIIEASERGTSISRQLLLFSRPEQAVLQPISLSHTISELQNMLMHFLPKSITIETSIEVEDGIILGDAGQIHQALLNLSLNAGDAMTNAGMLTIREFNVDAEVMGKKFGDAQRTPYVAVAVSDTGAGMEQAVLEKIFDPFFTTKKHGKGTGLGLGIVHGIMKNHHGFIDVKSEAGKGTTFTLYFPLTQFQESASLPHDDSHTQACSGTILIADDEDLLREMLNESLSAAGYTVITASNGRQALELYLTRRADIDLIITDLGMPQMGGEELFKRLKEIDPGVKVMVSSGYLDGITKDHFLQMGIKDVLTKPFKLREIQHAINRVMSDASDDQLQQA
jgi:PAS domain S-box-containing protein